MRGMSDRVHEEIGHLWLATTTSTSSNCGQAHLVAGRTHLCWYLVPGFSVEGKGGYFYFRQSGGGLDSPRSVSFMFCVAALSAASWARRTTRRDTAQRVEGGGERSVAESGLILREFLGETCACGVRVLLVFGVCVCLFVFAPCDTSTSTYLCICSVHVAVSYVLLL